MGASPAASPGASLQKEWCESGMLIVVTGETPAAAWLLKKGTGWLTGRPSGQGAQGRRLGGSTPQEMLHGFQLGLGLMGGKGVVSLGKQPTPAGGARCGKQAHFTPCRLGACDFQRQVEVSGLFEGLSEACLRVGPLATSAQQTRLQAVAV